MGVVHLLTYLFFGVQPRAYNRTELVDILGLVGEPKPESQESRPLLLSIVESFLNEVGEAVGGSYWHILQCSVLYTNPFIYHGPGEEVRMSMCHFRCKFNSTHQPRNECVDTLRLQDSYEA
jgi:hypothetical protein